jgi:hypothetical protein
MSAGFPWATQVVGKSAPTRQIAAFAEPQMSKSTLSTWSFLRFLKWAFAIMKSKDE